VRKPGYPATLLDVMRKHDARLSASQHGLMTALTLFLLIFKAQIAFKKIRISAIHVIMASVKKII
jgi:hypothetical protein